MKKKKKYLIIIVLFFLIVIVNIYMRNRLLSYPEKIIKDIGFFISNKITSDKDISSKLIEGIDNNLIRENEELKEILNINTDNKYLNASVINRNINYFFDEMIINKGELDGVKIGDAVITNKGFIGFIKTTTRSNSIVFLITNSTYENKISVKIGNIYGLMVGYDKKKNELIISNVSSNLPIEINSDITTGYSDNYSSGLYIGKVISISKDNFDLEREIRAEISSDIENIRYVMVVK